MAKIKWINSNLFGQLYWEQTLAFFDMPELFVCVDNNNNRFLVVLVDDDLTYLAVKVNDIDLLAMLNGGKTMEQTFRNASDGNAIYINCDFEKNRIDTKTVKISEVLPEDLPKVGVNYEICSEDVREYSKRLTNECINNSAKKEISDYYKISLDMSFNIEGTIMSLKAALTERYEGLAKFLNEEITYQSTANFSLSSKENEHGKEPIPVYKSNIANVKSAA